MTSTTGERAPQVIGRAPRPEAAGAVAQESESTPAAPSVASEGAPEGVPGKAAGPVVPAAPPEGGADVPARGHAELAPEVAEEVAGRLRLRGLRMTSQRERVITALAVLGHATAEEIAAYVGQDGGPPLPASTVYRTLDVLQRVAAVSSSHLDQRAPTYHLVSHADHLHLCCCVCGSMAEADIEEAIAFAETLRRRHGFVAETGHLVIPGRCAMCAEEAT